MFIFCSKVFNILSTDISCQCKDFGKMKTSLFLQLDSYGQHVDFGGEKVRPTLSIKVHIILCLLVARFVLKQVDNRWRNWAADRSAELSVGRNVMYNWMTWRTKGLSAITYDSTETLCAPHPLIYLGHNYSWNIQSFKLKLIGFPFCLVINSD